MMKIPLTSSKSSPLKGRNVNPDGPSFPNSNHQPPLLTAHLLPQTPLLPRLSLLSSSLALPLPPHPLLQASLHQHELLLSIATSPQQRTSNLSQSQRLGSFTASSPQTP